MTSIFIKTLHFRKYKVFKGMLFLCLSLFVVPYSMAQMAENSDLFKTMAAKDSLLFEQGFSHCEINQFEQLLHEDFIFYHDKSGITPSKAGFISSIKDGLCKMDYVAKRVLIAGTLKVFPLYNQEVLYGVIQTGEHEFYSHYPDRKPFLSSTAKFTHTWLLVDKKWQLSQSLSYDHQVPDAND